MQGYVTQQTDTFIRIKNVTLYSYQTNKKLLQIKGKNYKMDKTK